MLRRGARALWNRAAAIRARIVARQSLTVFNLHQISAGFDPRFQLRTTWTPLEKFERQLLRTRLDFDIVPLHEGIEAVTARTVGGRLAAITLDDGDASLESFSIPLLQRLRIPATLFVNSAYWTGPKTYWVFLFGYFANHHDASKRGLIEGDAQAWFNELRTTGDPLVYRDRRERIESLASFVDDADRFVVSRSFLESLDPSLFTIGLHGHEHQRFSMMSEEWQWRCVDENIAALRNLPGYRPLFAVPFGRPHDWDDTVVEIARERSLTLVLANGGINRGGEVHCQRIPADNQDFERAFVKNQKSEGRKQKSARLPSRA